MSMTIFPFRPDSDLPAPLPADIVGLPATANPPAEAVQLSDYVRVVFRHWRLLGLAAVMGAGCGILITFFQTPLFRAHTSIEIQNINSDFMNMKQMRPVADSQQGTDAIADLQTQIEILQSESLANSTKHAVQELSQKKAAAPAVTEPVLKPVADSLKVHAVGLTRIVQIQVDAPDPSLAAQFANLLVTEYIRQNVHQRLEMTEAAEDATRSQLSEMREKLKLSEEGLQRYANDHGLVLTSERQNISDDRLRQVQADLLRARTDLVEKEARRHLASTARADSLPDVAKDTDLRDLRAKLIDLRRQEAELLTIFKPDYSEVRKVRAQADEMQSAINQEHERIVSRIVNEYMDSSEKEKLLTAAYDQAVVRAAKDSQTAVQYDILKKEVDSNLSAYQEMLLKVKDLGLAAAIRTSNVRVIDPAEPPTKPTSPKMPVNIALGLFSGLALAAGFVLVQERGNQNLRHPGEAFMRLGVPELGVISSAGDGVHKLKPLILYKPSAALEQSLTARSIADSSAGGELDRYAPTTDDFRTLLTSIMFSGENGEHPKLVVITSFSPQEGKTTVASNLAVALARAGKRVLLVDGDLRKPQIHKMFGLPNTVGLGNLLQGSSSVLEAQQAVLSTSVARLSVLTSGTFTAAPADLLFDPRLRVLLSSFRERFDMVVIDSSPMMRIPDARLLGRNADGVVLVARANKTMRNSVAMACHRLAIDRSRVLGIVLNDWNGETSPYPS